VELGAVLRALEIFSEEPLNTVSDSEYVVNAVGRIPLSLLKEINQKELFMMFLNLNTSLECRQFPVFIVHMHSHTSLPGPLVEGNAVADSFTAAVLTLDYARASHSFFHQNAAGLSKQFKIPLAQAKDIVQACPDCQRLTPLPKQEGINP
ncbi:POK6 protein, partial [Chordeiles acutipennis]|nr:POK6 protein [Chordeiles acutipennis]